VLVAFAGRLLVQGKFLCEFGGGVGVFVQLSVSLIQPGVEQGNRGLRRCGHAGVIQSVGDRASFLVGFYGGQPSVFFPNFRQGLLCS
jgi:hypothetical protein